MVGTCAAVLRAGSTFPVPTCRMPHADDACAEKRLASRKCNGAGRVQIRLRGENHLGTVSLGRALGGPASLERRHTATVPGPGPGTAEGQRERARDAYLDA